VDGPAADNMMVLMNWVLRMKDDEDNVRDEFDSYREL